MRAVVTRRVAFINEKGGSLKTTLTVNLGAYFALERGARVLVVDLDPQGHAGKCLGLDVASEPVTVRELLMDAGRPPESAILHTRIDGLDLVVANKTLTNLPLTGEAEDDWVWRLSRQIDRLTGYDWVLFDSPPSLGLLSLNVLLAATEVVIPVNATFLALDGCAEIVGTIRGVEERYGKRDLTISLIVPTLVRSTRLASELIERLEQHFGDTVSRTRIGYNVKVDEAQSHGLTIWEYAPGSPGADTFAALAMELEARG